MPPRWTREIAAIEPDAIVTGFGSERLRAAGATLVRDFHGLSVTGLTEALRVIPRSWANYRALLRAADETRPDVFVPIDFPDFNFFLARALHRRGVPVAYYISPQLWAWRPGRIKTIRRVADRVLVIFPFEEAFYAAARRAGHLRWPSAARTDAADHRPAGLPRRARTGSGRAGGCAAAGKPAQRAARDPARSGAHRRPHRRGAAHGPVHRRSRAASRR